MPSRLLVITGRLLFAPYQDFLNSELPALAAVFDQVDVLPFLEPKGTPTERHLPKNVRILPSLVGKQKRRYYARQLLRPRAIWLFASWLPKQLRATGLRLAPLQTLFVLSSHRDVLEQCAPVREAIADASNVTVYSFWGNATALAVPLLAKHGVACCVRYHGSDIYPDRLHGNATVPWRVETAKASRLSLFVSQHGLDYFRKHMRPVDEAGQRAVVARLGVPEAPPNSAAQAGPRFVLVSCSNIIPLKRVYLIARVAKALARYRPVEWHHFGGGHDAQLHEELAVPSAGLEIHMHGAIPNAEVRTFYQNRKVDLLVNMSVSEGIPVSAMEAISFGIPVVAPRITGIPELVIPGRSGFLLEPDECLDPELCARRIDTELRPGGLLDGVRPREVWAERFDVERNIAVVAQLLKSCGSEARATPSGEQHVPLCKI